MTQQLLSRYDVRREVGRGGMGVVYEAHDARLDRKVAVKVLLQGEGASDRRRRFQQEARAASALNHPNIITVYDIDTAGDVDYIVMEYIDGVPLSALIAGGPLPIDTVIRYAGEIASALAAAHAAGIVHRDLKPANIMLSADGRIKVLDFGLSKVLRPAAASHDSTKTSLPATEPGVVAGTGGYMSPEQATGEPIDARSDIFSFGVVLYEMLTGRRAFAGDSYWSTLRAVLNEQVLAIQEARPGTPAALVRIATRCLEKDPAKRYASAVEVVADLNALAPSRRTARQWIRAHRWIAASGLLLAIMGLAFGTAWISRWRSERSLQAALRAIDEHIDHARYGSAFTIARELRQNAPGDPRVERAWLDLTLARDVITDPPGAEVLYADFGTTATEWKRLGTSPIDDARVPFGALRWRLEKAGFDPIEGRFLWWEGRSIRLHPAGSTPAGMVYVPPGGAGGALSAIPDMAVSEFWIGKYEVTNQDFKRFVDAGGYRDERFWKHPFVRNGQKLSWTEAMNLFRDRTGRHGPASWELGTFPDGRGEYPVGGVSWYEAAAFAEFSGHSLPTIAHWIRATGMANLRDDIASGNFASDGPLPVEQLRDLGAHGTFGMSGNVKEWCFNSVEEQRYLLGGGWNEPVYMGINLDARPPLDRSEVNGFRLARFIAAPSPALFAEVRALPRHITFPPPVGNEVFDAFRSFYAYDRQPFETRLERAQESEHWRKETVNMPAAYGRDRLIVHLLLPKNAAPPYQAVIYYPGSYAYTLPSSDELPVPIYFDFIPRSGRALIHPVYQGTYERRARDGNPRGRIRRDMFIDTAKDLGRTIDYLETRSDIDLGRLAFYAFSTGTQVVPAIAMEPRLKTTVFLSAGFSAARARGATPPPEIDPLNFAPRVKMPVLLLGGRYDFVLPLETAQKPFFAMLGTAPADKRHFIFDAGHVPPRIVMIRETLDWLDRYLGPVRHSAGGS